MLKERDILPLRSPNLIVTGANWTTTRAVGTTYQKLDGSRWFSFKIQGTLSSTTTLFTGTIEGIVAKNLSTSENDHPVAVTLSEIGVGSRDAIYSAVRENGSDFVVQSSGNFDSIVIAGEVELEQEPTI